MSMAAADHCYSILSLFNQKLTVDAQNPQMRFQLMQHSYSITQKKIVSCDGYGHASQGFSMLIMKIRHSLAVCFGK